jgi:YggT family protein
MRAILDVVLLVLEFYKWIVILAVIFSWLHAFNIINTANQFVATVWRMLYQMTEPVFQRVRRFIPAVGGLDLSPLVVLFGVFFLQRVIVYYIYPNVF